MKPLTLEIPEDVLEEAKIPPDEYLITMKRELAIQLYARGLLPKAAARRLSGLDRVIFDNLLSQRGIPAPMTPEDLQRDLQAIDAWRTDRADER